MTERDRADARQAQFDAVHSHQDRSANDHYLNPSQGTDEYTAQQRDFDRAAEQNQIEERHAAGERVADAGLGFDTGEGGGNPENGDDWEIER